MVKKLLGGLVVLLVLFVGASFFLPSTYFVERSIAIKAPPSVVVGIAGDLRTWPEWTAWTKEQDPDVKFLFEGPSMEAGSSYSWTGPKMGTGRLTVIDLSAERGVSYTLSFNNGQFESQGALAFHPTEGSEDLVVKWNNSGDLGDNPLYRWIGLVMDSRLGAEFEEGLANLKALAEAAADAGPTPAAEEAADPDGDSASPDPEGDSAGPEAEGAASDDDSAAPDSEGDSAVPGGEKPTSGGEAKAPEVEAGADAPAGETAE